MATGPEWRKVRLDPAARSLLDRALADLGRKLGRKLRLARLASGKLVAARVDDLWFCRVEDDGRPPRVWTMAVDTRPEQRTLLPADDPADFDECCDLLGLRDDERRGRFRDFLRPDPDPQPDTDPQPDPAVPPTAQGAS